MPSTITHSYFSIDVYNKLDSKYKKNINLNKLKVFAQGPDIYYFYNFLIGKKAKKIYSIGDIIHKNNIDNYFYNIIKYIKDNDLYDNEEIKSYLYGIVCHYILDTNIHPYIIYHTGIYNKNIKETHKYNGKHQEMEYYLDCYIIDKYEKINHKKYKMYKILNIKLNKSLKELINITNKKTYNINNTFYYYNKSLKYMYLFFKYINYDKYGIKRKIYKIIDKILNNHLIKLEELSYHIENYEYIKYLNTNKTTWNHPSSNKEYNYSFNELYNISIDKCIKTITKIDDMINTNINKKEIFKLFNLSYITGLNYKRNDKLKYFKY